MSRNNQNVDIRGRDLARRLTTLRTHQRLTKQELADRAGLSERTVHDLELGKRERVQEKTLLMLAEALDCATEDLLGVPLAELVAGSRAVESPDLTAPPAQPLEGEVHAAPDPAPTIPADPPRRFPVRAVLLVLLVLAAAGLGMRQYGRSHAVLQQDGLALEVRDRIFGSLLWRLGQREGGYKSAEVPWDRSLVLALGDGASPDRKALMALKRATGDTLWSVQADEAAFAAAFGDEFLGGGNLHPTRLLPADLDGDGEQEIVVTFNHSRNFPFVMIWISRDGVKLGEYAHPGHMHRFTIEDLDGDGKDEVLAAGTTNARAYAGLAALVLDEDHFHGAAVDPVAYPEGRGRDGSLYRLALPNLPEPYMRHLGSRRLNFRKILVSRDGAGGLKLNLVFAHGLHQVIGDLETDPTLKPLRVRWEDHFRGSLHTLFPDSLVDGTGPADPRWRRQWLGSSHHFVEGVRVGPLVSAGPAE